MSLVDRKEVAYGNCFYWFWIFHNVPANVFAIFLFVLGTFVFNGVKSFGQWRKNNNSPRLTVPATVVTKRTDVMRRRRGGTNGHHHYYTSTTYYVTFEVESGDRMELQLEGFEYGLLVEGDKGKLSFQGTRYLGFERT